MNQIPLVHLCLDPTAAHLCLGPTVMCEVALVVQVLPLVHLCLDPTAAHLCLGPTVMCEVCEVSCAYAHLWLEVVDLVRRFLAPSRPLAPLDQPRVDQD